MKVAILVPSGLKKTDGNTVRARRVISVIGKRFQTIVLAGRTDAEENNLYEGVPICSFFQFDRSVFLNPFKLIVLNLRFLRLLLRSSSDIVYAEGLYFLPSLFLASRLLGIKFIFEAHALAHKERAQVSRVSPFFLMIIELLMGKSSSAVVALSGETKQFFARLNKRTIFVPVFIDTQVYTVEHHDIHRRNLKRVGLVGPFRGMFNQGQIEFIIQNLNRFDPKIEFVLIGEVDKRTQQGRIKETGFLPAEQEYAKALAQLDALVVPVKVGTFGPKNKMIEAMACGVPVFSTPAGVIGLDFAKPNENIFVFKEDELVDSINSLLFEEKKLADVGSNARNMVEQHYSIESCERGIISAIELAS
jgi:glycosyltransferase involved in cell wall biosynthesis